MKKLITLSLLLLTFISESVFAQLKYYEDSFNGGVTLGGYSPAYNTGGTGAFTLNIASGSTVRKAYLIAGRHGNAPNLTVTLNGINYTFSSTNQATSTFQSPTYGGNSAVHAIDVSTFIDPSVNNYTLVIPSQVGPSTRYNDFALYVAFNNSSMAIVNASIFLNTFNFSSSLTYSLNLNNPINTSSPVGISVMTGYVCDATSDGEKVKIGNTQLGTIGSNDVNSGTCGGPLGSFSYSNNTLSGLSDDGNNLSMSSSDALSNVQTKVSNNATSLTMEFTTSSSGNATNAVWAVFLTYGYPSALPVQLTSFSGVINERINDLTWTTASEINCSYFVVEHSRDGINFNDIGTVQGAGNSSLTNTYTFSDEQPFPGTTYYRLRQMDYDGQYMYSGIISLTNTNSYTTTSVDVYTLQGQKIATVNTADDNYTLKNLTPGAYLLYYHTDKGIIVKKIMCREGAEPVTVN